MRKISFTLLEILIFDLVFTIPALAEEVNVTLEILSIVSISDADSIGVRA